MKRVTVAMEDYLYNFYSKVGKNVGLSAEKVMHDALMRFAGDAALKAAENRTTEDKNRK